MEDVTRRNPSKVVQLLYLPQNGLTNLAGVAGVGKLAAGLHP